MQIQEKIDSLASVENNDHNNQEIFSQQIDVLNQNLWVSVGTSFICSTLIFIILYPINHSFLLLNWYGAVILVTLIRFSLFFLKDRILKNIKIYFYIFMGTMIISSILWGIVGSVFMPDELMKQMILIVIISGISAGSVETLRSNFIASFTCLFLILAPLAIWTFLRGTDYFILGLAISAYLLAMLILSYKGNKVILKTFSLNCEKLNLIGNLIHKNNQLEKSYSRIQQDEIALRKTYENSPIGMATVSLEGHWLEVNKSMCNIVGYSKKELEMMTFQQITHIDDLATDLEYVNQLLEGKINHYQMEKRYIHKDQQAIWVLLTVTLMKDQSGSPLYFITQVIDINERKQNEIVLSRMNEKTNSMLMEIKQRESELNIINKMNDRLQTCYDLNEAYTIISVTAKNLFGSLNGGLATLNVSTNLIETINQWGSSPLLKDSFKSESCYALRTGKIYVYSDFKNSLICHHFTTSPVGICICLPVMHQGGITGILCLNLPQQTTLTPHQEQLATIFNKTIKLSLSNIYLREELRKETMHDSLTGLYNRHYLEDILSKEIIKIIQKHQQLCIAMIEIDSFKKINETYGYEIGDLLLGYVGNFFKKHLRGTDIACRFGGAKFTVALMRTTLNEALPRLKEIRTAIKRNHINFENRVLPEITVSIGIVEVPTHAITLKEIIQKADKALAKAKENEEDEISIFES